MQARLPYGLKTLRTGTADYPWALCNVRREASGLAHMVLQGKMSRAEIRLLVRVPRDVRKLWSAIPNPAFRARLREIIDFRLHVLHQFEYLLRQAGVRQLNQQKRQKPPEPAVLEAMEVPND